MPQKTVTPGPITFTAEERQEAYQGNYGPVKKRLMKALVARQKLHAALASPHRVSELRRLNKKKK